jgi:nucleotide-binding universal stress UspA family protein
MIRRETMHKKILHGLDGSEGSFKALLEAINLARLYKAELHTLTVEELPSYPETVGEVVEEQEAQNGKYREVW